MKNLKLLFVILLSFIGNQFLFGVESQATDNYYCGFKTESEFNLWTILRLDNDNEIRSWQYAMYEEGSVVCTCNLDIESNDWLISPMLTLTEGKQHYIKIKLGTQSSGQRILITMGKDKTAESQTEVLLDSIFDKVFGYLTLKIPDSASGNYYFGLNYRAGAWSGTFTIYSFYLTESEGTDLNGNVTNNLGETVVNAKVALSGDRFKEFSIETEESGTFDFNNLDPGDYSLKVTADGHYPFEENITIGMQDQEHPIVITKLSEYEVKGSVKSKENTPVKSATITLQGELTYQMATDENGNFLFEKVRECDVYKLKIEKDLKVTYTNVIDVMENKDLGNITLETLVSKPLNIQAQEIDAGMVLSWMLPLKATEIRYDSGIHYGTFTISDYSGYAVTGNIFDMPVIIKGISWMANAVSETVDVNVFSVNKDGSLSNQILYSAKNIKNINYEYDENYIWNEYYLPEEIVAPYGCVLALASEQGLEVLFDSGYDEGYPNAYKGCTSFDYRNGINRNDKENNYFIRLLGSPLGVPQLAPEVANEMMKCQLKDVTVPKTKVPGTSSVTYKIWRFESKNKENIETWTPIEINDQESLSYLDRSFKQLPKGIYQYGLQAVYGDGQVSDIGYSNEIEYKIYTNACFTISSDIGDAFADGATATLTNVEDESIVYLSTVIDSKVRFEHIQKGYYYLKVSKKGFKDSLSDEEDLSSNDNYEDADYLILELIASNPFNLKMKQNNDMDVTFSWNVEEGLFEDFERMQDFTVNPTGDLGWTYVDADGLETVGVKLCQEHPYPNMYAKMAFMCFNPSETSPDLSDYLKPYSGDKVLIDVATEEGQNDDYLFSPELSFENDFILSFYAKAGFFADGGNEEFMVGYSIENAVPEDVTWITTKSQSVGAAWMEFAYDIPKEAKFVTIRCVSKQKFFFVIDDLYIGYKKSFADKLANYEVFLDEESMGKTGQSQMTFPKLTKGKHIAKVQAVYMLIGDKKLYSDFVELAFNVNAPSGVDAASLEKLYTYNSQNAIVSFGNASEIAAYTIQGQLIKISKEPEINVMGWQSGCYVFKVKTDKHFSVHKIFIK